MIEHYRNEQVFLTISGELVAFELSGKKEDGAFTLSTLNKQHESDDHKTNYTGLLALSNVRIEIEEQLL